MELMDRMEALVSDVKVDIEKFEIRGNTSAGTRVRKAMQSIKTVANEVRATVTRIKNERKEG